MDPLAKGSPLPASANFGGGVSPGREWSSPLPASTTPMLESATAVELEGEVEP